MGGTRLIKEAVVIVQHHDQADDQQESLLMLVGLRIQGLANEIVDDR